MKWEYLVLASYDCYSHVEYAAKLDKAGADGWELTAVNGTHMFLKRPVIEPPPNECDTRGAVLIQGDPEEMPDVKPTKNPARIGKRGG